MSKIFNAAEMMVLSRKLSDHPLEKTVSHRLKVCPKKMFFDCRTPPIPLERFLWERLRRK